MIRRTPLFVALAACSAFALIDCGSPRLPRPTYVGHPTSALVEVPYPPPPARVEFVPDAPEKDAVWVDGEWSWRGRRWAWKSGRWVVVPAGASYSPWTSVRNGDGTLFFAPGTWRNAKGEEVKAPKTLNRGGASSGGVVNPEGEQEATGRNLDEDVGDGGVRKPRPLPGSSNVSSAVTSGEAGVGSPSDTSTPSKNAGSDGAAPPSAVPPTPPAASAPPANAPSVEPPDRTKGGGS